MTSTTRLRLLAATLLATLATTPGCNTVGKSTAAVVQALAADPATVRLRVNGGGVVIELDRTAPGTNTPPHTVSGEGTRVTGPATAIPPQPLPSGLYQVR